MSTRLSEEEQARIAWTWVSGLLAEYRDMDKAWGALRPEYPELTRRVFREVARSYRYGKDFADVVPFLPGDSYWPRERMTDRPWDEMTSPYIAVVKFSGRDDPDDPFEDRYISINLAYNETLETIQEIAVEALQQYGPQLVDPDVSVNLVDIFHKKGAAW